MLQYMKLNHRFWVEAMATTTHPKLNPYYGNFQHDTKRGLVWI